MKERERELDAPISYNKTTQNDDDKIYRKNNMETKQTPLLIRTFAESPTFSYWPIPNIIIILLVLVLGVVV